MYNNNNNNNKNNNSKQNIKQKNIRESKQQKLDKIAETNPLHLGEEILLNIKRIGINGEGIGYYKRLAVFVDGALPKEDVLVRITKLEEKYAYGVIEKNKTTNEKRIKPLCPYYESCGGCALQHASYELQKELKQEMVLESFQNYFETELKEDVLKPIIGCDKIYNYRQKEKMPVRYDGEHLVTGMYEASTNRLVYIDKCEVEDQYLRKCLNEVLDYLSKSQIIAFNPKSKDGVLRHVVIRRSVANGDCQVVLILYKNDERTIKISQELTKINHVKSVYYTINNDLTGNETLGQTSILTSGSPYIIEEINGLKFEIYPDSFFQINHDQASKEYYNLIMNTAKLKETDVVCDGYSGIGTIGLLAAQKVKEVRGFDNDKQAVKAAINNSKINNITNATFYNGDMIKNLKAFKEKNEFIPNVIFVNPPKSGLDLRMITYLQESDHLRKIIYVSSNPSTLAKNCNHLSKKYIVRSINPIDMYPHTANVECVVCLERR